MQRLVYLMVPEEVVHPGPAVFLREAMLSVFHQTRTDFFPGESPKESVGPPELESIRCGIEGSRRALQSSLRPTSQTIPQYAFFSFLILPPVSATFLHGVS
jgi:hypothetical protein